MKKINYLYLFIALATTTFSICSLVKEHNIFAFFGWGFAAIGYFSLTFRDRKK